MYVFVWICMHVLGVYWVCMTIPWDHVARLIITIIIIVAMV